MLILRRKKEESILIGDNIRITILECGTDGVRIAIDAPRQISILREELSKAEGINKAAIAPQSTYLQAFQTALSRHTHTADTAANMAEPEPSDQVPD